MRGFVTEAFPGPVVEPLLSAAQLRRAEQPEARALREVLAHESVGVLVASPLPGVMRVREVEHHLQRPADLRVAREIRSFSTAT